MLFNVKGIIMKEKLINIAANDDLNTADIKRKLIKVLTEKAIPITEGFHEDGQFKHLLLVGDGPF